MVKTLVGQGIRTRRFDLGKTTIPAASQRTARVALGALADGWAQP
jgi:hypothetical protein